MRELRLGNVLTWREVQDRNSKLISMHLTGSAARNPEKFQDRQGHDWAVKKIIRRGQSFCKAGEKGKEEENQDRDEKDDPDPSGLELPR